VLLQFYLAVIAISLIALILLARSVTRPIFALARRVRRIEAGDYGQGLAVTGQDEIGQLAGSINRMAAGLAEKEKVCSLLGKVVSHEIAEESLSKTIALVGEERVVAVLFADIKGFTSLCENLAPKAVLPLLNRYLSEITEVIERHHGVVDKYTGDSVMALFGAPLSRPGDAGNAIATALAIQSTIAALNTKNLAQGMFAIEAGIGVDTGLVVAGNLGSQNRLNYTVIGDSVNLSARLEGLTRRYHVPNIVSEATRRDAPGFVYRELDLVRVAGKKEPVRIFEVLGREGEVSAQVLDEADALARVLQDNRAQRWQQALQGLQALLTAQPAMAREASLYRVCAARIAALREETLPPDWDAVHSF
jgi:adenylate cyclase